MLRALLEMSDTPTAALVVAASSPHITLTKMGPQDDPEAFMELLNWTTEPWGWPEDQWVVQLLLLLSE